jgi:hypothetical protein
MPATPHDVLFRWTFAEPQRVAALLRALLPPNLVSMIQLEGIQKVPVELIDKDLSEKRTDLVWRLPLQGRHAWLYVILEHQSKTLRWMPLRLFDYERCVWGWWTDRHRGRRYLPPIVAVVVSNAPAGWRAPTRLWDLRETDPELEAELGAKQPDVDFFLEDLQLRKDEDIVAWQMDAVGQLALLLLKHGSTAEDLPCLLYAWRDLFKAFEQAWDEALPRFVCYILAVREDVTNRQLTRQFTEMLGKRAGELVMTEAERLMGANPILPSGQRPAVSGQRSAQDERSNSFDLSRLDRPRRWTNDHTPLSRRPKPGEAVARTGQRTAGPRLHEQSVNQAKARGLKAES